MERARELSRPYWTREGVIGIYVVGSATRPHRDGLSDYDIEVVLEDAAYARTPDAERQVFAYRDGDPTIVDYEFYLWPWSEFAALVSSTQDLFHYPYQHAVVLHDPEGKVAPIIRRLAELPEDVRQDRLRVHYLEFRFALGRARKTESGGRDRDLNLRLLRGDAVSALSKVLFLTARSWPATHHWVEQELRLLGVPEALLGHIEKAFAAPNPDRRKALVDATDGWLDERGETFHRDTAGLMAWAFHRTEGKRAFERWGGR